MDIAAIWPQMILRAEFGLPLQTLNLLFSVDKSHESRNCQINGYHAYGESSDRRWRENSQQLRPPGFFAGRVFDLRFDPIRPSRNRAE
jgi:hypothetical protein